MWHVWNVCPSIQSMRVIVSGERRKGSMRLSPCAHTCTHAPANCIWVCLYCDCRLNAQRTWRDRVKKRLVGIKRAAWWSMLPFLSASWFWFLWFINAQKHTTMHSQFSWLFFFPSLCPPQLFLPVQGTNNDFSVSFSFSLFIRSVPKNTSFIYFLLSFSTLRGSFPAVSTLGVSQRPAGVGNDVAGEATLWGGDRFWSGERVRGF